MESGIGTIEQQIIEQDEELCKVHDKLLEERINEQLTVNDMKEGNFYLARHKMHSSCGRSRMKRQGVLDYIREMNWNPEDMIIELANFPYDNNKKINN